MYWRLEGLVEQHHQQPSEAVQLQAQHQPLNSPHRHPRLALPCLSATPAGRLLTPPTPIMREDNWPLLTVSKGFFEQLATKGGCALSLQLPGPWHVPLRPHERPNALQPVPACKPSTVHPISKIGCSVVPPGCAADSERAKGAPGAAAAAAAAAMEELDMGDVGAGWGEEDDLGAAAAEGGCEGVCVLQLGWRSWAGHGGCRLQMGCQRPATRH